MKNNKNNKNNKINKNYLLKQGPYFIKKESWGLELSPKKKIPKLLTFNS